MKTINNLALAWVCKFTLGIGGLPTLENKKSRKVTHKEIAILQDNHKSVSELRSDAYYRYSTKLSFISEAERILAELMNEIAFREESLSSGIEDADVHERTLIEREVLFKRQIKVQSDIRTMKAELPTLKAAVDQIEPTYRMTQRALTDAIEAFRAARVQNEGGGGPDGLSGVARRISKFFINFREAFYTRMTPEEGAGPVTKIETKLGLNLEPQHPVSSPRV